jgi:hypothetical protein
VRPGALITADGVAAHLNPNDGQIGRGERYMRVIGRVIHRVAVACNCHRQQYRHENHFLYHLQNTEIDYVNY